MSKRKLCWCETNFNNCFVGLRPELKRKLCLYETEALFHTNKASADVK
ncbi:hypothetical protein HMPREF1981_02775 [Bacteroides pyogenes F0041]|uniref:Uncharacterized protein n=1 Tax=Bacteroides pyogenes F0041 TaxID=1321819 RepID=U2DQF6_9BACE|nr:hypothetical protein HMPREF1981_02775 [Bacteroides pyogenes F0041]